jgi:hypothetical protein
MNEIRLLKDSEPPVVERPLPDSNPSGAELLRGEESFEWGMSEPPPPEVRIEDRRVAQRYRAQEGRCWIGWHEAGAFRQSPAWILDISASGGLLATDAPPLTDRSVWLRLDNPAVPDWAEARVVQLQASQSGFHAVRLVFRGTCPYPLIKAVAFASRPTARPGPTATWNFNAW